MSLKDKSARSPHAAQGVQGAAMLRAFDELIELQRETLEVQRQILAQLQGQTARA